jgi:hypothetical protein
VGVRGVAGASLSCGETYVLFDVCRES